MNILVPQQGREDEYLLPAKELVYKFNKTVANDGEKIAYKLKDLQ
jgi:hypothetical protein